MRRISPRTKLAGSAVALSAVMIVAALAQRTHRTYNPFAGAAKQTPVEGTRSRAVFGDRPSPVANQPVPDVQQEPAAAEPSPILAKGEVPADILGFLERWRTSLSRGDLDVHVSTYAPKLDRFFRERNVSRDRVRREKERMFRIYPEVIRYDLTEVRLESQKKGRAVVTFKKDWDMSGARRFAGSERQRLTLTKAGDGWQIKGEEELKVYWVRR